MRPVTTQEVLRYLKLEEDDETAELLLPGSLCYLGAFDTASGKAHYWSYPTPCGVAWAELDANGSLGTVSSVPSSVVEATPSLSEHKTRRLAKRFEAPPVSQRSRPARAVWVSPSKLPAVHYHQAWYHTSSFDEAVRYYGAKVIKDSSAGPGTRYFYVQLTSGRYACIECHRNSPGTLIISLEVNTRLANKNSGGKIYVRDIEEILLPMGGVFKLPKANLFIGWSTDA